jgi:hypothetical protein
MEGEIVTTGNTIAARGEATDATGTPILLCIRQFRAAQPVAKDDKMHDYLAFVRHTVECLLREQSATLGGKPDGTRFVTVTRPIYRSYRSLGHKKDDGNHQTYWFPESPMDYRPSVVDFEAWIVFDRLSELTGDPRYRDMIDSMAQTFARCGFDPSQAWVASVKKLDLT